MMTPEQKRIKIAELCEWLTIHRYGERNEHISKYNNEDGVCMGEWVGLKPSDLSSYYSLPDYLNDLNAMAEAEKTLDPLEWTNYCIALRRIVCKECDKQECYIPGSERIADFWFYHASAPQRADAFLLTHGVEV